MRQIVSDETARLEEGLEILQEQGKSLFDCNKTMETRIQEILESTVKELKESIDNIMKNCELVEMKLQLRKERDQMDEREKTPEECKKLVEKSSDCNNSVVLKESTGCENELAADRTQKALESDHSSVSLDRQENTRVLDRATPPLKKTRSKSEGKFSVRMRLGTICFQLMEDIFS